MTIPEPCHIDLSRYSYDTATEVVAPLVDWVYHEKPDCEPQEQPEGCTDHAYQYYTWWTSRAVLALHRSTVSEINSYMIDKFTNVFESSTAHSKQGDSLPLRGAPPPLPPLPPLPPAAIGRDCPWACDNG